MASLSGRRIVEMVWEDLKPSDLLTDASFDNAVTTVLALSGSSNSVVHLIAMARRAGLTLDLARFDAIARRVPVLANVRPAGKYLMEDFFYAGGLRALLANLGDLIDGNTPQREREDARRERRRREGVQRRRHSHARQRRSCESDGLVVLTGNLAPRGAVMKPPAAEPALLSHTGRAVVFSSYDDMAARIDDPALDVDASSVLVLQNAGPIGAPGMPEWGQLPDPEEAARAGGARHGAHLRRPHERHELRRVRAPRHAGVVRRRAARVRARRRPDPPRRRRRARSRCS